MQLILKRYVEGSASNKYHFDIVEWQDGDTFGEMLDKNHIRAKNTFLIPIEVFGEGASFTVDFDDTKGPVIFNLNKYNMSRERTVKDFSDSKGRIKMMDTNGKYGADGGWDLLRDTYEIVNEFAKNNPLITDTIAAGLVWAVPKTFTRIKKGFKKYIKNGAKHHQFKDYFGEKDIWTVDELKVRLDTEDELYIKDVMFAFLFGYDGEKGEYRLIEKMKTSTKNHSDKKQDNILLAVFGDDIEKIKRFVEMIPKYVESHFTMCITLVTIVYSFFAFTVNYFYSHTSSDFYGIPSKYFMLDFASAFLEYLLLLFLMFITVFLIYQTQKNSKTKKFSFTFLYAVLVPSMMVVGGSFFWELFFRFKISFFIHFFVYSLITSLFFELNIIKPFDGSRSITRVLGSVFSSVGFVMILLSTLLGYFVVTVKPASMRYDYEIIIEKNKVIITEYGNYFLVCDYTISNGNMVIYSNDYMLISKDNISIKGIVLSSIPEIVTGD